MPIKTDWQNGDVLEASDVSSYLANAGLDFVTEVSVGDTSVSSVEVPDAFSATWTNYKIVYQGIDTSSMAAIKFEFLDGNGDPVTTDYQSVAMRIGMGGTTITGESYSYCYVGQASSANSYGSFDVFGPFATDYKYMSGDSITSTYYRRFGGLYTLSDSFTDFRFVGDAGTFRYGSIAVYGYRIS